ncbi:MAG: M67 family metallopeptidase [Anaerolineae bacterium]|uniref:M67 family metallopeptidase n=1 Tax=Promineifilum sp. TaxID=2664178 RepID=UPI001D53FCD3|nr:M67 family metallopeptidase [Anaerolineales bacterium]MCB8935685.1 M67 family metallopeptidase [Promineifilum sp.]MCO5181961.1 M67 family metallopeptidase [Promineifilum sp.]MCW5846974.1 M67 family metallopeptidase [Anaerolineae bacterium]
MLILPVNIHTQIAAHGAASYPHEGCGLLLGAAEDGRNVVTAACPLPNVWPVVSEKPERFRIDPNDWRDVELEAISEGLDVIGIFHSHPDHPPVASPRDLAWASWPGYSYLITQVIAGEPGMSRSWQLAADRSGFNEEAVEIV